MRVLPWSVAPEDATPIQKENFLNVQLDAIGVGLASAASAFLPVLLTRLGASSFQVGLLTAMPSITGFFLSVAVGRFLRSHRDILRWWNGSRLIVFSSYALMGLVLFVVPREFVVQAELIIWALLTVPRTVIAVAFTIVMNAVAGPRGRYELLSRRWSLLGLTTSISVASVGLVLDRLPFPLNYQLVFVGLSFSGWISYYYGSRIQLLDSELASLSDSPSFMERIRSFVRLIGGERAFVSFATKRFIYTVGLISPHRSSRFTMCARYKRQTPGLGPFIPPRPPSRWSATTSGRNNRGSEGHGLFCCLLRSAWRVIRH